MIEKAADVAHHKVEPDFDHPIPANPTDKEPRDPQEKVKVSATTARLLGELGMPLDMTMAEAAEAQDLFAGHPEKEPGDVYKQGVAVRLSALLNVYDKQIVDDAVQLRHYITNRLIEISSCGTAKDELRALELLGKISDVGLFTEKQEITVTHRTSEELEHAIKERVKRLIHSNIIDVTPEDTELDNLKTQVHETESEPIEDATDDSDAN
ncbi:MAG: hypothetical protein EBR82_32270 [Caulobacteraceae bacterium]|nr:hypothetical protein [Caulobacteraceae bacterium]